MWATNECEHVRHEPVWDAGKLASSEQKLWQVWRTSGLQCDCRRWTLRPVQEKTRLCSICSWGSHLFVPLYFPVFHLTHRPPSPAVTFCPLLPFSCLYSFMSPAFFHFVPSYFLASPALFFLTCVFFARILYFMHLLSAFVIFLVFLLSSFRSRKAVQSLWWQQIEPKMG